MIDNHLTRFKLPANKASEEDKNVSLIAKLAARKEIRVSAHLFIEVVCDLGIGEHLDPTHTFRELCLDNEKFSDFLMRSSLLPIYTNLEILKVSVEAKEAIEVVTKFLNNLAENYPGKVNEFMDCFKVFYIVRPCDFFNIDWLYVTYAQVVFNVQHFLAKNKSGLIELLVKHNVENKESLEAKFSVLC